MYLTQSNVIRGLSKQEYTMLREMCQYSNNLYNVAVYMIRQHYFDTQQFLRYEENYPICKENENYGLLQAGVAQQILKMADRSFRAFFSLLKKVKTGDYSSKSEETQFPDAGHPSQDSPLYPRFLHQSSDRDPCLRL